MKGSWKVLHFFWKICFSCCSFSIRFSHIVYPSQSRSCIVSFSWLVSFKQLTKVFICSPGDICWIDGLIRGWACKLSPPLGCRRLCEAGDTFFSLDDYSRILFLLLVSCRGTVSSGLTDEVRQLVIFKSKTVMLIALLRSNLKASLILRRWYLHTKTAVGLWQMRMCGVMVLKSSEITNGSAVHLAPQCSKILKLQDFPRWSSFYWFYYQTNPKKFIA